MSIESTERIEEEAIEWLLRRDSAEWNAGDEGRLQQWLDESIAHQVAFIRLEVGWERARRLTALGTGIPKGLVPPPGQWQVSPFFEQAPSQQVRAPEPIEARATSKRRATRTRFAAAASVLIAIGAAAFYFMDYHFGDRYTTPVGGVAAVPLSDGSRVTLNTASEIRVDVTDKERRIALTRGEAYFEVAKDAKRPFVVEAGSRRVVAVGTQFSVRRNGDAIEVVVTEGEVRVQSTGASSAEDRRLGTARLESVSAGKIARANREGLLIEKRGLADLEEQLAWRAGYLVFNETPLAQAVAEFNRYSANQIVIEDPVVASYRVSGKFRLTSSEAFVRLLGNAFPIEARHEDARIQLSSRQ